VDRKKFNIKSQSKKKLKYQLIDFLKRINYNHIIVKKFNIYYLRKQRITQQSKKSMNHLQQKFSNKCSY
jgi:hypothetical protein